MVLVYAEAPGGHFKKTTFEAVTYGKKTADVLGTDCVALVIGEADNPAQLGKYGASKVHHINHDGLKSFDSRTYAHVIAAAADQLGADTVVMMHSAYGKAVAGRVAVRLDAGLVAGCNAVPSKDGDALVIGKSVFSGKALAHYKTTASRNVFSLMGNSIPVEETGSDAEVAALDVEVPANKIEVLERKTADGEVPLPEAERVVSAGRGMKGPENWGIIEELADAVDAATACSRPVADVGWRPHHEHVGQTGVAIRPNLYFAIGISGAIQHLAGVNNSDTIVVINKDPEAPFFSAADYGVVGDLFEVVPRLTEAIKKFKAQQ